MKRLLLVFMLLASCAAVAQVTFNDIDQTTPWKICSGGCAGGTDPYAYGVYPNQSSPSRDGRSTALQVRGPAWTDVLFIRELGPLNAASNFQSEYWFYLSNSATTIGQAFEFDTFQFINNLPTPNGPQNVEFMFGAQCDYGQNGGVWDIWDQNVGHWIPQYNMPCVSPSRSKFRTGVWYRITWTLHRVPPGTNLTYGGMSYDSVRVTEYGNPNNRNTVTSNYTYHFNTITAAGPLPAGWSDQLGVQWQIDLNGNSGAPGYSNTITEWIDLAKLTAW